MAIETGFDISFIARLALKEKQIQQNYRPVIGVHKWFARRPGSLFRGILLAEFCNTQPLELTYLCSNNITHKVIGDPFMGGGTPILEANRLGCSVVGCDINPMAYWVVRQELATLDREAFVTKAEQVARRVEAALEPLYQTRCVRCGSSGVPIKYFLWVKLQRCAGCGKDFDLSPGNIIAMNARHPNYVVCCPNCHDLVEFERLPKGKGGLTCPKCKERFSLEGPARNNTYICPHCNHRGAYPRELRAEGSPRHRLQGMEYYCPLCKPSHTGRFFKAPDSADLRNYAQATALLKSRPELPCPDEEIPRGDETNRLHRWGYRYYRDMFNYRQLLGLGLLFQEIQQVEEDSIRYAMATVFSDFLRYQNMLCRYDLYALKCQDIFAVHGFPVGLTQCENNLLGIPGVGSGSFRHFVEKYNRAKAYCEEPFETVHANGSTKVIQPTPREKIVAEFVSTPLNGNLQRMAFLVADSAEKIPLKPNSLDAILTDPPYFNNVQYAELMDFCYVWLRRLLAKTVPEFGKQSTRCGDELTGNITMGRGLEDFTRGLSRVFCRWTEALKPGAPFVFTYHHNELEAYVPITVAILDAGLACTGCFPCPAEMGASLHINDTRSSMIDSVIVCRKGVQPEEDQTSKKLLSQRLRHDIALLNTADIRPTKGDLYCIGFGHLTKLAVAKLQPIWDQHRPIAQRMFRAECALKDFAKACDFEVLLKDLTSSARSRWPSKAASPS